MNKLHHLGIAVRNLQQAAAAFQALGLELVAVEEVPGEKVRVAFLPVGETHLELLEPTGADSPVAKFLEKRGEGLHHLCLQVADLEAAVKRAQEAGLELVAPGIRPGASGARVCFFHPKGTHGVLVELWQEGHAGR